NRRYIDGKSKEQKEEEGSDQRYRNRDCRNEGGPHILKENKDDYKYQNEGLEQCMLHLADRFVDLLPHAVGNFIIDSFRKRLLQSLEHFPDFLIDLHRIGARRLHQVHGQSRQDRKSTRLNS